MKVVSKLGTGSILIAGVISAGCVPQGSDESSSTDTTQAPVSAVFTVLQTSQTSNCPNGGVIVDSGIDSNRNGTLDPEEVDRSQEVCHGTNGVDGVAGSDGTDGAPGLPGADGTNGSDGVNGADGLTSLINIIPADTALCPTGGHQIQVGLDANRNGILDSSEVNPSGATICNPDANNTADGLAKVKALVGELRTWGQQLSAVGGASKAFATQADALAVATSPASASLMQSMGLAATALANARDTDYAVTDVTALLVGVAPWNATANGSVTNNGNGTATLNATITLPVQREDGSTVAYTNTIALTMTPPAQSGTTFTMTINSWSGSNALMQMVVGQGEAQMLFDGAVSDLNTAEAEGRSIIAASFDLPDTVLSAKDGSYSFTGRLGFNMQAQVVDGVDNPQVSVATAAFNGTFNIGGESFTAELSADVSNTNPSAPPISVEHTVDFSYTVRSSLPQQGGIYNPLTLTFYSPDGFTPLFYYMDEWGRIFRTQYSTNTSTTDYVGFSGSGDLISFLNSRFTYTPGSTQYTLELSIPYDIAPALTYDMPYQVWWDEYTQLNLEGGTVHAYQYGYYGSPFLDTAYDYYKADLHLAFDAQLADPADVNTILPNATFSLDLSRQAFDHGSLELKISHETGSLRLISNIDRAYQDLGEHWECFYDLFGTYKCNETAGGARLLVETRNALQALVDGWFPSTEMWDGNLATSITETGYTFVNQDGARLEIPAGTNWAGKTIGIIKYNGMEYGTLRRGAVGYIVSYSDGSIETLY